MIKYEVTCITKPDRFSPHEHITEIGGLGWRYSRNEAIALINSKTASFYVKDKVTGKIAYVGVVKENTKNAYLRTYADGVWNDNLLALNECRYM